MFLSAGQSVVLDATFLTEESREQVRQVAARAVVPATFVFADCPEQTVRSRLRRRSGEYSVSDAKLHVYLEMKSRFTPPRSSRELVRIDTSQPLKRSLAKIERALLRI
jgi:predicted kinase